MPSHTSVRCKCTLHYIHLHLHTLIVLFCLCFLKAVPRVFLCFSHTTGLCHAIVDFLLCGPWSKDPPCFAQHLHPSIRCHCGDEAWTYPLLYPPLGAQNRGSWVKRIRFSCFALYALSSLTQHPIDAVLLTWILFPAHEPWMHVVGNKFCTKFEVQPGNTITGHGKSFHHLSVMTFWVFGRSSDQYPMR